MTNEYEDRQKKEHENAVAVETKVLKAIGILGLKKESQDTERLAHYWDFRIWTDKIWISFSASYGDKRIHVSGIYPRDCNNSYIDVYIYDKEARANEKFLKFYDYGKVQSPSITISKDKTPEQIANDITKRFMPAYNRYLELVNKKININNDYESKTRKTLELLAGRPLTEYEKKEHKLSIDGKKFQEYEARADVNASREDVTLEIHNLTPEIALKIINIIK